MTKVQQVLGNLPQTQDYSVQKGQNNLYKVNFKNNGNDQFVRNSQRESLETDRNVAMQKAIQAQDKERKKNKNKQELSWALGIAVSLAFVAYFGTMGISKLKDYIKNSGKNFKKQFIDLSKEKGIVSADSRSIDKGFKEFIADIKAAKIENPKEMYEFLGEEATPNMILLTGGSGVGKSYNADVACKELGWKRLRRQFSDVSSKYIGETSVEVQNLFKQIEKLLKANPNEDFCLVLDEADSLFVPLEKLSGEGCDYLKQMRSALLNGLDSVRKYKNFHLIATTNAKVESGMIDKAILRRIGRNYDLPYSDVEGLLSSLETHLGIHPYIKRGKFDFFRDKDTEIRTFLQKMVTRRAGHGDIESLAKDVHTKYSRFIKETAIKEGAIKVDGNKYVVLDNAKLQKIYDENPFDVKFLEEALQAKGTLAGELDNVGSANPQSLIQQIIEAMTHQA